MEERLREMFRQEMSGEQEPPLGELVEGAVRDGRHRRRQRRVWLTASVTGVAAALAVTAFAVMPGSGGNSAGTTASARTGGSTGTSAKETTISAPVLAAESTSTVIKQPPGAKLPVTDAAAVEQLIRLLPKGRTSGYAGGPREAGRYAFGQVYLDTGKGPGMVRVFIYKGGLGAEACRTQRTPHDVTILKSLRDHMLKNEKTAAERQQTEQWYRKRLADKLPGCRDLPGGGRAQVTSNSSGSEVAVDHGNGVTVQIMTTDWLAWNGKGNPAGTVVLTPAQALEIAANPAWGAKMDASLVKKAAADHPSLPTVN